GAFNDCPVTAALLVIRDGRLVGLVLNAPHRSPGLPDVPTTAEAGYADAELPIWIGLLAPAKTSRDIIARLHAETEKAMRAPITQQKLAKAGVEPLNLSPAEFDARIRQEIVANGALAKVAGIKPN